jgi:hypothetical protein
MIDEKNNGWRRTELNGGTLWLSQSEEAWRFDFPDGVSLSGKGGLSEALAAYSKKTKKRAPRPTKSGKAQMMAQRNAEAQIRSRRSVLDLGILLECVLEQVDRDRVAALRGTYDDLVVSALSAIRRAENDGNMAGLVSYRLAAKLGVSPPSV